jgi:aspartate/methionine/tyrosine aminotransferase
MTRDNAEQNAVMVALTLFAVTAARFLQVQKRKRLQALEPPVIIDSMVGLRGHRALQDPLPYLQQFLSCLGQLCDPLHHPSGYIPLCVAENRLAVDVLADRFMQVGTATSIFSDSQVYCYNSFMGMPVTREAAAYFVARRFLFPNEVDLAPDLALRHINAKHIGISAGGAALLNNLFFILGDPGDACLIPCPYYAAFDNDMNLSAGIVPVGIVQADPVAGPTVAELTKAYKLAKSRGLTPKFILLTNPNNPLGTIYTPQVMLRTIQWARKHKMHTIADEMYALGTHSVRE